jgi:hypothetical protein
MTTHSTRLLQPWRSDRRSRVKAGDCIPREAITRIELVARSQSVESDHPATRGAVIAFVTKRSCRRRAWFLLGAIAELRSATSASRSRRLLWGLGAYSRVDRS